MVVELWVKWFWFEDGALRSGTGLVGQPALPPGLSRCPYNYTTAHAEERLLHVNHEAQGKPMRECAALQDDPWTRSLTMRSRFFIRRAPFFSFFYSHPVDRAGISSLASLGLPQL